MSTSGIQWSDLAQYVPLLTNGGVAGLWIIVWLKGWIVSSRELDRTQEECSEWKSLYMQERDAHEKTRDALRIASQRGESTTEALQMVTSVMNAVRTQAGHEALPEALHARTNRGNRSGESGHRAVRPPGGGRPDEPRAEA